jgi:hypothetical protein
LNKKLFILEWRFACCEANFFVACCVLAFFVVSHGL